MTAAFALVTGGTGGIGRAIALRLADAGHSVAITGRNETRLREVLAELVQRAPRSIAIAADLREPAAADRVLARVAQEGTLAILVNNAGTAPSAKFERTDDATLDEVLDLHVRAPFRLIRAALPQMRARDAGCVVQLASSAGLRGYAFTAAYTAAKHAMVGMTRALALELVGSQVRAYAVCPGFVDTDITRQAASAVAARGKQSEAAVLASMGRMNRIGRMHRPDEVAAAVQRLCADRPAGCVYDLDHEPARFLDA